MGPHHKWASHVCKAFLSPLTPPLCPCLAALGMGAVGPLPLGLRVSSCGQRFSLSPPFFSKAPCPLCLLGLTLLWSTHLSLAHSASWRCHPLSLGLQSGPQPATWQPLAGITPLYLALRPPSLQSEVKYWLELQEGLTEPFVMRTGYRAPNGIW